MDVARLKSQLQTEYAGRTLDAFEEIDSTQKEARRQVVDGRAKHGKLIVADYQTGGIGSSDRKWASSNANLLFTVIIEDPGYSPVLSLLPGIVCAKMLRNEVGLDAHVKWVNDVLAGDEFRKISGTLIDRMSGPSGKFALVGIGVNINQESWEDPDAWPTSAKLLSGKEHDVVVLLARLLFELEQGLHQTQSTRDLNERLVAEHRRMTKLFGKWATAELDGRRQRIQIVDINPHGALDIRDEAGTPRAMYSTTGFHIDLRTIGENP